MWEASAETARSSLALIKVLTEVVNFLSPEIRNICCTENRKDNTYTVFNGPPKCEWYFEYFFIL